MSKSPTVLLQFLIQSKNRMSRERNLDSIRAIEEQIAEHEMTLAKLKRTRNSLLNVSTLVPPELLGDIFHWTTIPEQKRNGLRKASYNFLFVCHHWSQVALSTPQLWTSWGDSLRDWERRFTGPRVPRLYLELTKDYSAGNPLNQQLRDTLQDRAAGDFIRRVKLTRGSTDLLNSIVSSITVSGEGIQSSSMESFELCPPYSPKSTVELSGFFSRHHFPKLRHLRLSGCCTISPWDSLPASRTTALSTLSLTVDSGCPAPTTSQLLSILSSNPFLRCLRLSGGALPNSNSGESSFQVQLRNLKDLQLSGGSRDVLGMLDRLVPADKMDNVNLCLFGYSASDISESLGRYLGDHFRRRGKLKKGLAVAGGCEEQTFFIKAGDVNGFDNYPSNEVNWFMEITGLEPGDGGPRGTECERSVLDSIAHIPHDHTIELRFAAYVYFPRWFAEQDSGGTRTYRELLPSLTRLLLVSPILNGGDWSPLTIFVSCRASVGKPLDSLVIRKCPHMCPDVMDDIRRAVRSFEVSWSMEHRNSVCPYDKCLERGGSVT